jgi:molecular chaperone DnaK
MAADNMSLGRFRLEGIPPAPRGVPQVEVTFDIDANGILNVTARDKATSKEQKVTITASTNLSKQEIEAKVQESREHEAEDRKRRELAEARNTADSLAYQTEKTLRELGERVPVEERSNIENKLNALRESIKSDDLASIRRQTEDIQNAFHAISQQLYAQQQGGPTSGENGGKGSQGPDGENEVVEGEFREA